MDSIGKLIKPVIERLRDGETQDFAPPDSTGDSVLEERFWEMMRQTRGGLTGAIDQFQIGPHRVDAIVVCDGKAVVIELDGKAFHNSITDTFRDDAVLRSVNAVVRIPFHALWDAPYATFHVLSLWFPRFEIERHNPRCEPSPRVMAKSDYTDWLDSDDSIDEDHTGIEIYSEHGTFVAWVGKHKNFYEASMDGPPCIMARVRGTLREGIIAQIYSEIQQRQTNG